MFEDYIKTQAEIERRKRELAGLVSAAVPDPDANSLGVVVQDESIPSAEFTSTENDLSGKYFLDILSNNEEIRRRMAEDYERNEKSRRARLALASLTDGLAALGNLVGTTQGAFSQPQTYQTPFVTEQVEADRARARQLADRLRSENESIRLAQAKLQAADEQALTKAQQAMDLENARFEHNKILIGNRGEEARATEGVKHENRTLEETQKQEGKEALADKNNASREAIAAGRNATSRANTQARINASGNRGGGGGLTQSGRAMQIQREAELAVQSELEPELRRRGVHLPYGWEKNWKRYVRSAPEFYEKYYRAKGWEDIGGTVNDVTDPEKKGGFKTGGNKGTGKTGGFKK